MKAQGAMSETVLNAISIIITFILIALFVSMFFGQQSARTYNQLFESVARDTAVSIDRTVALAGSGMTEQAIPEGLKLNMSIDYKSIFITYDGNTLKKSFSGIIHTGPYRFSNPKFLCFVKNRYDQRINIVNRQCSCDPGNQLCDPECSATGVCDPKCYSSQANEVCNPFCARDGDGVCDPDCYVNGEWVVADSDC